MNKNNTLSDKLFEAMQPLKYCPECGGKLRIRVSFKGRSSYRNKRKTQYCECGFSHIIPTRREALIQLGFD